MGDAAVTYSEDFSSPVSAGRLFKALIVDGDQLISKLLPQVIKSVELVEGNGGPGSIKKMTLAEGDQIRSVKHRVDELDEEKFKYSYTVTEGGAFSDKVESISYEIKFEPAADGGSKGTNVSHYHPKPGAEITHDQIKAEEAKAQGVFKVVEAYLQANPDAYMLD